MVRRPFRRLAAGAFATAIALTAASPDAARAQSKYQSNNGNCNTNIIGSGTVPSVTCNVTIFEQRGFLSELFDMVHGGRSQPPAGLPLEVARAFAMPFTEARLKRINELIAGQAYSGTTLAALYAARADFWNSRGQAAKAAEDYLVATKLDANNADMAIGYGRTLTELTRFEDAMKAFEQASRTPAANDPAPKGQLLRVTVLLGQAQVQSGMMHFNEALRLNRDAVRILEALSTADPDVGRATIAAHAGIALALNSLHRPEEATPALDAALRVNDGKVSLMDLPLRSTLLLMRAELYRQAGDFGAARSTVDQALQAVTLPNGALMINPIVPILLLAKSQLEYADSPDQARSDVLQAVATAKGMTSRTPTRTLVVSQATWTLAQYQASQGDIDGAERSARESVDALRELAKQLPGATMLVALRQADFAWMQLNHRNLAGAEDAIADAIALERDKSSDSVELQGQYADHLLLRAQIQQAGQKWQEALGSIEDGVKLGRIVSRSDRGADVVVAGLLLARAISEYKLDRPDAARSDIDDALTLLDGLAQINIPATRPEMADVVTGICRLADGGEVALERCKKGIAIWRRVAETPPDRFEAASLLADEANLEISLSKPGEAAATLIEALRVGRDAAGDDPHYAPALADYELGLGGLLSEQGDASGVEAHLKAGLASLPNVPSDGPAAGRRAVILAQLAAFYLDNGKYDLAIDSAGKAAEILPRLRPEDIAPYDVALAGVSSDLGEACYLSHQGCARPALEDAARGFVEAKAKQAGDDGFRHCRTLRSLGLIDMDEGRPESAVTHLRDALVICKALASEDPRFASNVRLVSADLHRAEQAAARTKRETKRPRPAPPR